MRYIQCIVVLCIMALFAPHVHALAYSNEELNENWHFYEKQLLTDADDTQQAKLVNIPIEFQQLTGDVSTYGTFVKQITIPKRYVGEVLAFELPFVYGALKLYIDGQLITEIGRVGTNESDHETKLKPTLIPLTFSSEQATVAIQLSSFHHIRGGFGDTLKLAEWQRTNDRYNLERMLIVFCMSMVFIVGALATIIGSMNKKEKMMLTFGLFSIVIAIRALFSVPFLYHDLPFDISYVWATKMEYITTNTAFLLYVLFIYQIFQQLVMRWIIYGSVAILAFLALMSLLTEPLVFQTLFFKASYLMMAFVLYSIGIIFIALKRNIAMAKPLFLGILFVFAGLIVDLLSGMGILNFPPTSLFTITVNVLIILLFIGKRYTNKMMEVTALNNELRTINTTLDKKVQERTYQLVEVNKRLANLAARDGLTGISNRFAFDHWLEDDVQHALETKTPLSLLLLDVDEFKKYNEYYGHVQGDQLLKAIAKRIERSLPPDVKFARYGGEEFVFLLPNYTKAFATVVANSLQMCIQTESFEHLGREEAIATVSIGGAELLEDGLTTGVMLLERADARLYYSKEHGRNKVTMTDKTKLIHK